MHSNVPSLRTVRFIFTSWRHQAVEFWELSSYISDTSHPDWPWICRPSLLAEDSDDVVYYQFPLGRVVQTAAAVIPQDLWKECWSRWPRDDPEDWPRAYYGGLDEMERIMDEECAESGRRFDEGIKARRRRPATGLVQATIRRTKAIAMGIWMKTRQWRARTRERRETRKSRRKWRNPTRAPLGRSRIRRTSRRRMETRR